MTTVSLSWPTIHLLKLAPVGDTQPEVFGLSPVAPHALEPCNNFRVSDPSRVRMLCDTLQALAPTMGGDQRKVLEGAEKRLRAALTGEHE